MDVPSQNYGPVPLSQVALPPHIQQSCQKQLQQRVRCIFFAFPKITTSLAGKVRLAQQLSAIWRRQQCKPIVHKERIINVLQKNVAATAPGLDPSTRHRKLFVGGLAECTDEEVNVVVLELFLMLIIFPEAPSALLALWYHCRSDSHTRSCHTRVAQIRLCYLSEGELNCLYFALNTLCRSRRRMRRSRTSTTSSMVTFVCAFSHIHSVCAGKVVDAKRSIPRVYMDTKQLLTAQNLSPIADKHAVFIAVRNSIL